MSEQCKETTCYGCGTQIREHSPGSNTWTHIEWQDHCCSSRPKVQDNDRPMNWQDDETAMEYKARVKHYYDGVIP